MGFIPVTFPLVELSFKLIFGDDRIFLSSKWTIKHKLDVFAFKNNLRVHL